MFPEELVNSTKFLQRYYLELVVPSRYLQTRRGNLWLVSVSETHRRKHSCTAACIRSASWKQTSSSSLFTFDNVWILPRFRVQLVRLTSVFLKLFNVSNNSMKFKGCCRSWIAQVLKGAGGKTLLVTPSLTCSFAANFHLNYPPPAPIWPCRNFSLSPCGPIFFLELSLRGWAGIVWDIYTTFQLTTFKPLLVYTEISHR